MLQITRFGTVVQLSFIKKMHNSFFTLKEKEWETNFFGFKYGVLQVSGEQTLDSFRGNLSEVRKSLSDILSIANSDFDYIEVNLDSLYFFVIPILEDFGFRLLDTKNTYLTKFTQDGLKGQIFELMDSNLRIRKKRDSDFDTILKMAVDVMVNDKVFVSKYKNLDFFDVGIAEKYYKEWIRNTFYSENSYFSILTNSNDDVKGFFIYDRSKNTKEGLPIYKGILTAIDSDVRGKNLHLVLQSFIFKQITEEQVYIENATQVSNIPVIRNHIRSHRMLDNVAFILLRKKVN